MMLKVTCCVNYDYNKEFIILALGKSNHGRFHGAHAHIPILNG